MKKIILSIVIMVMTLFMATVSANMELFYDGTNHEYSGPNVNLIINNKKFELSEGLLPPIILEDRTLVPVREVFEMLGGIVNWNNDDKSVEITLGEKSVMLWIDKKNALVNDEQTSLDVPAKIINSKTMVPVRFISENCGLVVGWDNDTKTVTVDLPKPKEKSNILSVEYKAVNNVACFVVNADSEISGYKYFSLSEPYRLILDVENSTFKNNFETQKINDNIVSTIRFGKQENDVSRIVVDLIEKQDDYIVVQSSDMKTLYLALDENFKLDEVKKPDDKVTTPDENQTTKPDDKVTTPDGNQTTKPDDKVTTPDDSQTTNPDDKVTSPDENQTTKPDDKVATPDENQTTKPDDNKSTEPANISAIITGIKYNSTSDRTRVIFSGKVKKYETFWLQNPLRLVVDINNAYLGEDTPTSITPKNKFITGIRVAQNTEDMVRVVFDLSAKVDYDIVQKSSELQINMVEPTYKNVEYVSNANNTKITLKNVKLDNLTLTQNSSSKTYTIKYSSSKFDTGKGTINVNDDFIKNISITKTKITIEDKSKVTYKAKQSGNDVIITVKGNISSSSDDKVIVIDVGHGGSDPGSTNKVNGVSYYEKDYNLAVALKLYDLINDTDGMVAYIDRDKDKSLTVNERVDFINSHDDAVMVVSIHHNSVENKNYGGTVGLYYTKEMENEFDITSKELATILAKKLSEKLGTYYRGLIERKDPTSIRILSETNIPGALCEIAFISNDDELARIVTEEFQETAAEAILEGIKDALKKM